MLCYDMLMTEPSHDLISQNFKLAPFQVQQLALMSRFHGSKTRVLVVALDRLYRDMLATNPAFAELAAAGGSVDDGHPTDPLAD